MDDKNICQKSDKSDQEYANFVEKLKQMKRYPKLDESKLVSNPFVDEFIIEATVRLDGEATIKDEFGCPIPASQLVEKEKTTRIYKASNKKSTVLNLSAGGKTLFLYIMYTLEPGQDWIRIMPEWYSQQVGKTSKNTYSKAIQELIEAQILTPTMFKYTNWVNPRFMFSGSRINKYSDNVVVRNAWKAPTPTKTKKSKEVNKPVNLSGLNETTGEVHS